MNLEYDKNLRKPYIVLPFVYLAIDEILRLRLNSINYALIFSSIIEEPLLYAVLESTIYLLTIKRQVFCPNFSLVFRK